MQCGYQRKKKYGLALSYYEKAYKLNPDLMEAKKAAVGIRGRFWSDFAQGPLNEVKKQQEVREGGGQHLFLCAWRRNRKLCSSLYSHSSSLKVIFLKGETFLS